MKFDFVVVGSGPAGSIISEELSKNGFNIALIDRASYESPRSINHFFCPYIDKTPNFYTPVFSNVLGGNSLLGIVRFTCLANKNYQIIIGTLNIKN